MIIYIYTYTRYTLYHMNIYIYNTYMCIDHTHLCVAGSRTRCRTVGGPDVARSRSKEYGCTYRKIHTIYIYIMYIYRERYIHNTYIYGMHLYAIRTRIHIEICDIHKTCIHI